MMKRWRKVTLVSIQTSPIKVFTPEMQIYFIIIEGGDIVCVCVCGGAASQETSSPCDPLTLDQMLLWAEHHEASVFCTTLSAERLAAGGGGAMGASGKVHGAGAARGRRDRPPNADGRPSSI